MKKIYALFTSFLLMFSLSVNAAVPAELTAVVDTMKADTSASISYVGAAILTLAGLSLLYRWVKATFF